MAQVNVSANGDLLDALGSEWAGGVDRLNEFELLFGDADHVELLNLVGGAFFADVQRIFWDDQLLRLTRLTDPPRTVGKDNLTVKRLPDLCEHDELRKKVEEQVAVAVQKAEFARSHRNQRISHKDLAYAIGGSELPSTTLGQVRGALDAVHAVLQTVQMGLQSTHLSNEVLVYGGVPVFLHRTASLVDAVRCVEELLADLSGQAPPWNVDVATDCIRRLGGTPSQENVQRIIKLRSTAAQLRADAGSSAPGDGSRRGT